MRVYSNRCWFLVLLMLLGSARGAHAQTSTQLWLDGQVSYPFGNRYLVESTFTYQTLLSSNQTWSSFSLSPNFEYALLPRMDITAEIPIGYTRQTDTQSSMDISPMVGAKFHITQGKRINMRVVTRFQSRNFESLETGTWEHKGRFRLRGEVSIAINKPNMFNDNLWSTFLDYEEFIVIDDQVNERFANLRRARWGVGYRASYKHRFEIAYTWQRSRDAIGGQFTSNDSIIQLRYKLYLNPPKVSSGT